MERIVFRRSKPLAAVALLLVAVAISFRPAWAASAAEQFVQSVGQDVVDTLKSTRADSAERETRLRQVFVDAFATPTIARFVMGRHWRTLEDAEKQRYLEVFPGYVAAIYASRFADYSGQVFQVVRSRPAGDNDVFVETEIRGGRQNRPIAVGIRVRKMSSGFKMIDVTVEGISLLVTKRDEFNTFLSRQSVSDLIDRLAAIAKS